MSTKKSELPARTASAVVMLAVAGGALWAGDPWWDLLTSVVAILCFAELSRLVWQGFSSRLVHVVGLLAGGAYVFVATARLQELRYAWPGNELGMSPLGGIMSVMAIIGVVVFTDTGAYFAGRAIGGPKIAPRISPSKTWAGLGGGMLAAAIWGVIVLHLFTAALGPSQFEAVSPLQTTLVAAFTGAVLAIVAQFGDFLESWMKRRAALKDSSNLIPGHGGIFDRVDGLLPVAIASMMTPYPFRAEIF